MDSKQATELLEKYWNCETSLEEEQQLRSYFSGGQIPDSMKDPAELFRFFETERTRSLGETFDVDLKKQVRKEQKGAKVISMVRWVQMARIAAGVLVVVAAGYFVRNELRKSSPTDTFDDPALALEETKKVLMMISKGFGKAKVEAGKMKIFNEAEKKIQGKEKDEKSDKINI